MYIALGMMPGSGRVICRWEGVGDEGNEAGAIGGNIVRRNENRMARSGIVRFFDSILY